MYAHLETFLTSLFAWTCVCHLNVKPLARSIMFHAIHTYLHTQTHLVNGGGKCGIGNAKAALPTTIVDTYIAYVTGPIVSTT